MRRVTLPVAPMATHVKAGRAAAPISLFYFEETNARDTPSPPSQDCNRGVRPSLPDARLSALPPDEYQDGISAGSLVKARRCWQELSASGISHLPQRFAFQFRCPTQGLGLDLIEFLRGARDAGYESTTAQATIGSADPWHVVGTTHVAVWSLSSLEHLFMRMRGAGPRYASALVSLDLLSTPPGPH